MQSEPPLRDLLTAANAEYQYSAEDKAIIRKMVETDRDGLLLALRNDYLLMYRVNADAICAEDKVIGVCDVRTEE